ncbi:hypothetical protein BDW59DRAFT_162958 [Aspergillus cavernicola]|uniref:Uncharacterized protein n=1 Tax=Aspergillus cavernicola TaxID=176166 RepID=A0ABR4I7S2_9EURO
MSSTPYYDPGLENFFKLPPELQLCIWDQLHPISYKQSYKRPGLHTGCPTTLTILRTSHRLHDEISHHLYHNIHLDCYIKPTLGSYWASANIMELYKKPWKFRTPKSAMDGVFANFPYERVGVRVFVCAPDPDDSGQLIDLWEKVNQLADLLVKASSVKHIQFILHPLGQHTWAGQGKGRTTIRLFKWKSPRWQGTLLKSDLKRNMYDHEVVEVPAMNWSVHCFAIRHLLKNSQKRTEADDAILDIMPRFICETNRQHYLASTHLTGPTAAVLRRRLGDGWKLPEPQPNEVFEAKHGKSKT